VFGAESKAAEALRDTLLGALQQPDLEGSSYKVIPVFVLENLHQHTTRQGKPVQPLLDKGRHVVSRDGIVVVLRVRDPTLLAVIMVRSNTDHLCSSFDLMMSFAVAAE
jgi:hypothetical protein